MISAAAAAVLLMAGSASAVTVVSPGGSYDITSDNVFLGDVASTGGAGSYTVNFTSPVSPLQGSAHASLTVNVANTFKGLTMSWLDAATSSVLSSTAVLSGITSLSTTFTGSTLSQNLVFNWSDSKGSASNPVRFDFDVSAVPVPAGGLLLLTALGGLGLVRRRKSGAVAA